MAYNLPPPWDPGFALPQNVRDEGLERQAFVTKEMPRGTYDAPEVGTGGYAVPAYIMSEGYGQGTHTTKWLPPGSITNAPVPHRLNVRPVVAKETRLPGGGRKITIVRKAPRKVGSPATHALSGMIGDITSSAVPLAAAAGIAYLLFRKKR